MPTFDTGNKNQFTGTGGSQTIGTFTVGANSNRYLLVFIWSTGAGTIATPSYAGSAMTPLTNQINNNGTTFRVFGLLSPTTGSNNLTSTSTNGAGYGVIWYSIYNVSQTNTIDNSVADSGSSLTTSQSVSVTPTSDSDIVVFFGTCGGSSTFTMSTPTNNPISSFCAGNSSSLNSGFVSNTGSVTPIASQTGTVTNGATASLEVIGIVLKALTQTSAPSLSMMNGASRSATSSRSFTGTRSPSSTAVTMTGTAATFYRGLFRTITDTAVHFSTLVTSLGGIWKNAVKHATSFTGGTKHSSSWTDGTKHSSTFTNQSKSTPA